MINLKHMVEESKVSYSALVLDEKSHNLLLQKIPVPEGWQPLAHHMTISMGPLRDQAFVGMKSEAKVVAVGQDDKVVAVKVETTIPSINAIKHITVAVNRSGGGKPVMSGKLTNWTPIELFVVRGVVEEVQ